MTQCTPTLFDFQPLDKREVVAAFNGGRVTSDAGMVANLALAFLIDGRIADAIQTVNKSLELAPDDKITQDLKSIILEVQAEKRVQPRSARDL